MALEGANIIGQAQVYNQTQSAVNQYAKLMQQQQAKREAEQKALSDKLSKFSTDGLREVDKNGFYEVYDAWKAKSAEALAAKDQKEKFRLNSEAKKEELRAIQYVADSKNKTKRDTDVGMKILGKPYFFSEEGKTLFNKSLNAPIYSKDDILDYNSIPLGYDKNKVSQDLNKLNASLLNTSGNYEETKGETKKVGSLTVVEFPKIKRVPQEQQINSYELLYNSSDGFQAFLEDSYSDLDWDNNKEQALQTALVDFTSKSPIVKDEGVDRRSVPRPRASSGGGEGASSPGNYTVETDVVLNKAPKLDELGDVLPNQKPIKALRLIKSVGFDTDSFTIIKAKGLDIDNAKRTDNVSGNNFKVGKLAYVPVEDGSVGIRAIIIDGDGKRFAIDPSSVPVGIRNSKNFKAAIKALGQAPKQQSSNTSQGGKANTQNQATSYSNITQMQDANGKTFDAGVKNGKWYNIKTGKEIQ